MASACGNGDAARTPARRQLARTAGAVRTECAGSGTTYPDPSQPIEARIADLLSQMTLEERRSSRCTRHRCDRQPWTELHARQRSPQDPRVPYDRRDARRERLHRRRDHVSRGGAGRDVRPGARGRIGRAIGEESSKGRQRAARADHQRAAAPRGAARKKPTARIPSTWVRWR